MAKTLLNGTNEVLKRLKLIAGDSAALTTLVDSTRQNDIDLIIQLWNEQIDDLYSVSNTAKPNILVEDTITLVTSDRDYALPSALTLMRWPMVNQVSGAYIYEFEQGYEALFKSQAQPDNFTGQPQFGVIRPTDGELYFDRVPTATENGAVYTFNYSKDTVMSAAADAMPFKDIVFRAMVPVVAELWKSDRRKDFSNAIFKTHFARATRYLSADPHGSHY